MLLESVGFEYMTYSVYTTGQRNPDTVRCSDPIELVVSTNIPHPQNVCISTLNILTIN